MLSAALGRGLAPALVFSFRQCGQPLLSALRDRLALLGGERLAACARIRLALLAAGLEVGLHLGGARLYYTIYQYYYIICIIHLTYDI